MRRTLLLFLLTTAVPGLARAQTVALRTFDEPQGLYPSSVIDDSSGHDYPLVLVPTREEVFDPGKPDWHHLAFFCSARDILLRHFVDGIEQLRPRGIQFTALPVGDEAYMSIGRDGLWNRPLPGKIDELRISLGQVHRAAFSPPGSFARPAIPVTAQPGPPPRRASRCRP